MNTEPLEISNLMKNESPVFIVGAPRSGSSILYRTLQRHSSFNLKKSQSDEGVNLVESRCFKDPYNTYSPSKNSSSLAYMIGDNNNCYRQFINATQWIQDRQRMLVGKSLWQLICPQLNSARLRKFIWKGIYNDHLLRIFFYYAKEARGINRIIEKTPQHILYLPEIKETFPNAKLLFIHRHPVDVFSSYQKRLLKSIEEGMNQSNLNWLKISPRSFCHKYARYIQLAINEHKDNPRGFMLIQYESFTSKPQETLAQICSFIEEPYEPNCIPDNTNHNPSWKVDENLFTGIKKDTNNGKFLTNESDARLIEDRLHNIMLQLGYPRYT